MIAIEQLAAEGRAPLFLILAGVVVAALLIGAFWFGSKRSARRKAPAQPQQQNAAARQRAQSWKTPDHDPDEGDVQR
ncbi:DUF6479 family protein [Streptomyces sp. NPDC055055]